MQNTEFSGFEALNVARATCKRLSNLNITVPTPIQEKAIPIGLQGQDLIGIAQTGTGKTLAFALPIAERIKHGEIALVIAPTRELAQQIAETTRKLDLATVLLVGGDPMSRQIQQLRGRFAIIVATPGRLMDHMEQGNVRMFNVSIVVLDEADRMLDMGFAPAIKRILAQTPSKRQTMLFSATMPSEIEELAQNYLKSPARIQVDVSGTAPDLVDQELVIVKHEDKQPLLQELLAEHDGSVLVFARTRHGARKLARAVRAEGHSAAELHSDRTLAQRRDALQGFKSGGYRILVATDIAARGIDVKEISLVINYDVPEKPEDYVHRIGRTGRAGAVGKAITIALPQQANDIRDIERLIGNPLERSRRSIAAVSERRPAQERRSSEPRHERVVRTQPARPETHKAPEPSAHRPEVPPAKRLFAKPGAHATPGTGQSAPEQPQRKQHRGWSGRPRRGPRKPR